MTKKAPYPTRLTAGQLAYVAFVGKGNNMRSGPGTKFDPPVASIPQGAVVKIVGGPTYDKKYIWWKVQSPDRKINGGKPGWTAEGDVSERWLVPIKPRELCDDALPSRMRKVKRAYVVNPTDSGEFFPRVCKRPGKEILGWVAPETTVAIINGKPKCAENMVWWRIQTPGEPLLDGWMSEGKKGEGHYLLPLKRKR